MQILQFDGFPERIQQNYYEKKMEVKYAEIHKGYPNDSIKVHRQDGLMDIWRNVHGQWVYIAQGKSLPSFEPLALKVVSFYYLNAKNDEQPEVLVLGEWRIQDHVLLGGINLNSLEEHDLADLGKIRLHLKNGKTLRDKCNIIKNEAPNIFNLAYRTYDIRFINRLKIKTI